MSTADINGIGGAEIGALTTVDALVISDPAKGIRGMGLLDFVTDVGKGVIGRNPIWTERAVEAGTFLGRRFGPMAVRAARSPILAAGQQTIESMKAGTGTGEPEDGQCFRVGGDALNSAGRVLASAFPDDNWDGGGAAAYADCNTDQVGRVQTMVGLDHVVAGVLAAEAGQIAAARTNLDSHSDWLGSMSLLTTGAGLIPGYGTAALMGTELAMVTKAVSQSLDDLDRLRGQVTANAATLQDVATQYATVAGGTGVCGTEFDMPTGEADESDEDQAGTSACDTASDDEGAVVISAGSTPSSGTTPSTSASTPSTSTSHTPTSSTSSSPTSSSPSGTGATELQDALTQAAGAAGTAFGSLMSPLGVLGGVMQAVAQAVQGATQGMQTAAGAAAGLDSAGWDETATDAENSQDSEDRDEETDDRDREDGEDGEDGEDEAGPGEVTPGDAPQDAGETQAGPGRETAKTLPPDLQLVSAGGGAAGPAPVHVGTDFGHGQLRPAGATTLDAVDPGPRP